MWTPQDKKRSARGMPSSYAHFTADRYQCTLYKNCMHSCISPKVGGKRTRGLVGCPETGIPEIEPEKRRIGKGPSELNADRWSAVMSGGGAEPIWQIESSNS